MFNYKMDVKITNPFTPKMAELVASGLAEYLVHLAKATVPVRTGRLKGSIHVDKTRSHITPTSATKIVIADIEYAAVVEYGRTKFAPFPGRYYMKRAMEMLEEYIKQYMPDMLSHHSGEV